VSQADGGQVTVNGLAVGGNGGVGGSSTGNGGNARSTSTGTVTGSHGNVTVNDAATGGNGSTGGGASSTAIANAGSTGSAAATATATTRRGGLAVARATASGSSGAAFAKANTMTSTTSGVSVTATAPVHSTDTVETRAGAGIAVPDPSLGTGLQAFTYVTANPLNADVLAALSGSPNVHSNFDVGGTSDMLGLAAMGAAYPADGTGVTSTFTGKFDETIDLSQLANLQHLMIGLVNPTFTGNFDALRFLVTDNGMPADDITFRDISSAMAFFTDQTLDPGSLAGMTGSVDLGFEFDFTSHQIGDSFAAELVFGNTTAGSGPSPGSPVPEPATGYLVGIGLAALAGVRAAKGATRPTSS
jgi:hypothetical protein